MLIIGSVAACYWIQGFRQPKDLDVWMLPHDFQSWYERNLSSIIDFRPQRNPNKFFAKFVEDSPITMEIRLLTDDCPQMLLFKAQEHSAYLPICGGRFKVASAKTLLKLKRSHLEFPLRWEKHINDYADLTKFYKTNQALCDSQQDNKLLDQGYQQLYTDTCQIHGASQAKLNMSNEAFFAKSAAKVHRTYDHDSIHRAVMFYDQPIFEKIKSDLTKANCSKDLWNKLSHQDKVRTVQEESMVIALERKVLPKLLNGEPYDASAAFAWALMRVCTSLTSGWFRDFALDNWRECASLGFDFVAKLDQKRLVINE